MNVVTSQTDFEETFVCVRQVCIEFAKVKMAAQQTDVHITALRKQMENPWIFLQMMIGEADTWPQFIRSSFWEIKFNDHNWMVVVNFAYKNGVCESLLHDVLKFTLKRNYTRARQANVAYRYVYFDDIFHGTERRSRAYSYDTTLKAVAYLDGRLKKRGT